ncbi:MAG: ATP phosphoribosyltransferase [Saprospiraceae bacterium]|nr:ATP phosphoribosyltransferase [Saprospiraceae bacterium]HMS69876.1 ATP phosphoribosyltransferase [Saprospiraceae bacterium]HOY11976.1 ATP phosphoribosyltransferase [Saprospiraceae bacterium]HPN69382.1 ATP phosphoribosyltransferase [Saprospiraceae bacterium]
MIKIAVQKSGRLYEDSLKLLKDCGLSVEDGLDTLKAQVRNFDAEVLFLRNSDIPKYLEDGVADIAILGENVLIEKNVDIAVVEKLGFSKCRLSVAVPKGVPFNGPQDLNGKKIATSYPHSLQQYLNKHNVTASIHLISGSVEIAPNIGLADAICDLVSSGNTLFKNGLEEKEILLKSEAVLAANKNSLAEKSELIEELAFRIRSVLKARKNKYILFNIPNDKVAEASQILPVLKSPTVLPLLEEGWSSMHSVINDEDFWTVLNKLEKCGAQGILVIPIEKMIV